MSASLVIRILGGVLGSLAGTYVSGHIYDYFNRNMRTLPQIKSHEKPVSDHYDSKIIHAKSFEEILNIELNEASKNQTMKVNKLKYEYDNEHGNALEIEVEQPDDIVINDTLYDCNYFDFYQIVGR